MPFCKILNRKLPPCLSVSLHQIEREETGARGGISVLRYTAVTLTAIILVPRLCNSFLSLYQIHEPRFWSVRPLRSHQASTFKTLLDTDIPKSTQKEEKEKKRKDKRPSPLQQATKPSSKQPKPSTPTTALPNPNPIKQTPTPAQHSPTPLNTPSVASHRRASPPSQS